MAKHVAIVGAGLGGLRAAEQLRAAGHAGPVTVVGAEPHLPYSRPPLSKELLAHELLAAVGIPGAGGTSVAAAAADAPADDAAARLAALHAQVAFRHRPSIADITFRLGVPVTAVALGPAGRGSASPGPGFPGQGGELALADGELIRFDGLVAATGLRPRRLNVPGPAGPGSGRHVLRTLDDLLGLRAELRAALAVSAGPAPVSAAALFPGSVSSGRPSPGTGPAGTGSRSAGSPGSAAGAARPRVVVVGAGFVGCEVACTALALGCEVTVVEPAGPPLLRVLGEQVARAVQRAHERAGITFVTGQAVTGYTGTDRVTGVVIAPVPDGAPAPRDARAPGGAPIPSGLAPGGSAAASPAPGGSAPSVPIPSGLAPGGPAPGGSAAGSPAPGGPASGGPASGGPVPANRVLPADLVVEAIGSVPNTEWLAGTGLDLADGVLCDNSLAAVALPPVTGGQLGPLVVAVGDIARFPNPLFDNVPRRVEHWSMPTETARRAAATLHARLEGNAVDPRPFRPLPYFWSDQGELRLQSFGTLELADDVELTEGDPDRPEGGLLATYRRAGRLVGSLAVNLPPARYRELREALLAAADS